MTVRREKLRLDKAAPVATITIDDPPRNFVGPQLVSELDAALGEIERDDAIRCVIVTSALPGLFITHYDVPEFVEMSQRFSVRMSMRAARWSLRSSRPLWLARPLRRLVMATPMRGLMLMHQIRTTFERLPRSDKIYIAALPGLAMGVGLELALYCDIRLVAASDQPLGFPESALGDTSGVGGAQRMIRTIGPLRASELLLEGRLVSGQEALDVGLVHRLVEPERLLDDAQETARRLATRPVGAVRAVKAGIEAAMSMPLARAVTVEQAGFMHSSSQPEAMARLRRYAAELQDLGDEAYDPEAMLGGYMRGDSGSRVDPESRVS